jgi:hypothetical protein
MAPDSILARIAAHHPRAGSNAAMRLSFEAGSDLGMVRRGAPCVIRLVAIAADRQS